MATVMTIITFLLWSITLACVAYNVGRVTGMAEQREIDYKEGIR